MVRVNTRSFSFISWNLWGLGDEKKCSVARDALSPINATVIYIQESKLSALDLFKARSFLPAGISDFVALDAVGSCGGIVTTWDSRLLVLSDVLRRKFSLTTVFVSTTLDLSFTVTNVYPPSDHGLTSEFVREMIALAPLVDGPWISLGDYNLIRYPSEKNNDNFDRGLAAEFNLLIRDMGWFELDLRDRRFTWTNGQEVPVLARLDRAFFNASWNSTFPMSFGLPPPPHIRSPSSRCLSCNQNSQLLAV
jgi:hypothetical protein